VDGDDRHKIDESLVEVAIKEISIPSPHILTHQLTNNCWNCKYLDDSKYLWKNDLSDALLTTHLDQYIHEELQIFGIH
jgi:hypothetical protein